MDRSAEFLLTDLNAPQRAAVTHRDGPLLVIAGPGSGKTRVITRRAAHLVHTDVPAHNILAITFTNKAADEMRRRIADLGVGRGMWVYTFHALGARLLREFGPLARVEPGFTIYDEADALRVIKDAMAACKISEAAIRPDTARKAISDAKSRLDTPDDCYAAAEWYEDRDVARIYEAYQDLLEQRNAVDFDDLLMRIAVVLRDHPDIAERLNIRFRYVLIDEYQDTNHAQYLIARLLSQHHHNICVTGDPDQSIYAWRGADLSNILEFERDYPDARVVRLEQNYRSTPQILQIASRLIAANRQRKHKDLWTENSAGTAVRVWEFSEDRDEADRVATTIREMHAAGRSYDDFAIFYRVNALSRGFEEALRNRGIPYKIARGVEFYNRKEIRDVLAYLRLLVNPSDEVALLRVINTPARGIGKTTIERLRTRANETNQPLMDIVRHSDQVPALKAAAKRVHAFAQLVDDLQPLLQLPVSTAVGEVLAKSGLEQMYREERESGGEDRLANIQELVTAAIRYEQEVEQPALSDFLNRISLTSDQDAVDEHGGCVMLMTLHAAKGLEFPVVFLAGLEQGLLPHERSLGLHGDVEEERRLCFVGVTRAEQQLFLSRAQQRLIRGQPTPRPASQFLTELDDGTLTWENHQKPSFGPRGYGFEDGFEPDVSDLPPEEAARLVSRRRLRSRRGFNTPDGFDASQVPEYDEPADPDAQTRPLRRTSRPRDDEPESAGNWSVGTVLKHESYGVGQILWLRAAAGQTRAGVRFAGLGEKTLILEIAPIERLSRHS